MSKRRVILEVESDEIVRDFNFLMSRLEAGIAQMHCKEGATVSILSDDGKDLRTWFLEAQ